MCVYVCTYVCAMCMCVVYACMFVSVCVLESVSLHECMVLSYIAT